MVIINSLTEPSWSITETNSTIDLLEAELLTVDTPAADQGELLNVATIKAYQMYVTKIFSTTYI